MMVEFTRVVEPNLVSVIIPTYNSANYIEQCLDSVISQDYSKIEIIVIDDGSNDNTNQKLRAVGKSIKIISISNSGAAVARNYGLMLARGEFLAFLDSDDYWSPQKISLQVKKLKDSSSDLCYCSVQEFYNNGDLGNLFTPKYFGNLKDFYLCNPTVDPFLGGPGGVIIRKDILAKSGIFDPKVPAPSEDWDFFRRVAEIADVTFVDQILLFKRVHDKNISKQSLRQYLKGNHFAIRKMHLERQAGFCAKSLTWFKFYLMAVKQYMKNLFNIK
jgi:glycosyltransferase involved in cell wall biosynthesis